MHYSMMWLTFIVLSVLVRHTEIMLCDVYPMFNALLSVFVSVDIELLGTHVRDGLETVYPHEIGSGTVNITLPSSLYTLNTTRWNRTSLTSEPAENGTLSETAYRLQLDFPNWLSFNVNWSQTSVHPIIVPLNLSNESESRDEEFLQSTDFVSSLYLDFVLNRTRAFDPFSESIDIVLPIQWTFFRQENAGIYSIEPTVSLSPYDWEYFDLHTAFDNSSSLMDYLIDYDLISEQPVVDQSSLEEYLNHTSSNITFPFNCLFVDRSYSKIETWANVTNCSRCLFQSSNYSLRDEAQQSIMLAGPRLVCNALISSPDLYVAGSTVSIEFTAQHDGHSNEKARLIQLKFDLGSYLNLDRVLFFTNIRAAEDTVLASPVTDVLTNNSLSFTLTEYSNSDNVINISITTTLKDTVLLNSFHPIIWDISYVGNQSVNGGDLHYYENCAEYIHTPNIATDGTGGMISMPIEWGLQQPAEATFQFIMPPGTIESCIMSLSFEVDAGINVPVDIVQSIAASSESSVVIETPNGIVLRRKKRAVSSLVYTHNVGTITNPASSGGAANVSVTVTFRPTMAATSGLNISASGTFTYAGATIPFGVASSIITIPKLTAYKVFELYDGEPPQTVRITVFVRHTANSSGSAYNVKILDTMSGMKVLSRGQKHYPTSGGILQGARSGFLLTIDQFTVSDVANLSYLAEVNNLRAGTTQQDGTVTYQTVPVSVSANSVYDTVVVRGCTEGIEVVKQGSALYTYGSTAGAAIGGFFAGIIIVVVIAVIIIVVMKKKNLGGYGMLVHPDSATDYFTISRQRQSYALLLDAGQTFRDGWNINTATIKDSIVRVLSLGDRLKVNRELDNLDIQGTMELDRKMEKERLDSMIILIEALLVGLLKNNDITRAQYDTTMKQFKAALKDLDTTLTEEYKKSLEEVVNRLATHNRAKLGNLMDQQRTYKQNQLEEAESMSIEEKKEFMQLIDVQLQTEQDNLSYKLKLEQDEEQEKLRKEFALKKRIRSKEIQQHLLQQLKIDAKMTEEQASWLLKEHAKNQAHLEKMHDDELTRQRFVLERKLAKRRALAELSDLQEKNQSELLNTLAGGQIDILKKAKKSKLLTASEARDMSESVMQNLTKYKQALEQDQQKQEMALHDKLSKAKRQRLEAKEKELQQNMDLFEKNCKQQQADGTLDPLSVTQTRLELIASHEVEKSELEIQIDQENATELRQLREKITQITKSELRTMETKQLNDLKKDGMRNDQIESILRDHDSNIATLDARLSNQYQAQENSLKMRLRKRKKEWEKRMEQDKEEKAQLREHEEAVVSKLVTGQLSMSEEERDKILKEHDKNIMRLENNMTLNKLQQRKMLEKKLAERRAKKMADLQQKQRLEKKKLDKQHANEDEDEQEAAASEIKKRQAEERVAVLTEEDEEINLDDELEQVRLEMMQQRAVSLREQEDKLGSMVAQLQLSKAKEIAEIDEKQRAINALKANLIDDLSERGVMSDREAEEYLENHRSQQEKLTRKLDAEKDKQEKALKKKLMMRLEQRENTLMETYESRLKDTLAAAPNKLAAKLKKAAFKQKRMLEIEEFKSRMEKEISQTLEETRRQHNVKKTKLIQELEIRFIASLIKQGKLKRSELKDCLTMLFPGKSDNQLEVLINSLHDPNESAETKENDMLSSSSASMLRERIQRSVSMYQSGLDNINETDQQPRKARPKSSKKKSAVSPLDFDISEQPNKNRLPPLNSAGKKKKLPSNTAHYDNYDM